ncbi:DNA-binding CsgD family transcriptional regulator [Azospirillum fermentarium]|uniref:helix-turn-helix transcriptional regulator n=1 Tax=Azospirillum fermentarium TaxID=1233114 RepID=UPI0022273DD0|nr:LuxR family transcriptional regulator [Azospirillum fermentarium]MCW2248243.1 DNA-binding CsgD family transcriptional regulator [Azospirillum fermentarium]
MPDTKDRQKFFDAVDSFRQADSIDDLWNRLHRVLADYGVGGIFYGSMVLPYVGNRKNHQAFIISSYRQDYLEVKLSPEYLDHDPYYNRLISEKKDILWSNIGIFDTFSEMELKSTYIDFDFNITTGVTLPFQFAGNLGISGCSLHTPHLSWGEFERLWQEKGPLVRQIVSAFDVCMRERHIRGIYPLTPRETECLQWLANGLRPQQIAFHLGTHAKTVEKQISDARAKLQANNAAQAVAKALILGLIEI